MSEAVTEELVPLAPPEESAPEPVAEATPDEEAAGQPDEANESPKPYVPNKALQRFQEKVANQSREIAEIKQLILAQASKPQTAAVRDRLEVMLEEAKAEYGETSPGLLKIVNALAEEIREGRSTRSDLQAKLEDVRGAAAYADFMAGRSAQFRTEFAEAQAELEAAGLEEYGEKPPAKELRLAMTVWTRNWDKQHQTPSRTPAKSGTVRAPLIPTGSGPRSKAPASLSQILESGHVPDGKGGVRAGNLLGI